MLVFNTTLHLGLLSLTNAKVKYIKWYLDVVGLNLDVIKPQLEYNSASEMFVNLNIPSFYELLRKFVYSFKSRIQDSCNSLANGIVKSSVPLFSKIWVWWNDILYT